MPALGPSGPLARHVRAVDGALDVAHGGVLPIPAILATVAGRYLGHFADLAGLSVEGAALLSGECSDILALISRRFVGWTTFRAGVNSVIAGEGGLQSAHHQGHGLCLPRGRHEGGDGRPPCSWREEHLLQAPPLGLGAEILGGLAEVAEFAPVLLL